MNDPELLQALSTLADEVDLVDLEPGVLGARRRLRTRRVASAGIAVLAVLAATAGVYAAVNRPRTGVAPSPGGATAHPTVAPSGGCVVGNHPTWLPVPAGGRVTDAGVWTDPTGRHVASGNVLWTDGVPSVIPGDIAATGVNADGDVVGYDASGGWLYHAGTLTMLPAVPGYTMRPTGINASGDIIGVGYRAGSSFLSDIGVEWPAGHAGDIRTLRTAPSRLGSVPVVEPDAITDDGTIIGTGLTAGDSLAFVWKGTGPGHPLDMPADALGVRADQASYPWAEGTVVEAGGSGTLHLIRWNLDTGGYTVYPYFPPVDIDRYGDMLVSGDPGAYVLHGNGQFPLPIPAGYPPEARMATSMSDDGHVIVGRFSDTSGAAIVVRPVEWRC